MATTVPTSLFGSAQVRVRGLKSRADDRSILTLLRQLKFLQGGNNDVDAAAAGKRAWLLCAVSPCLLVVCDGKNSFVFGTVVDWSYDGRYHPRVV